jgi:tetratricopeptide (TPR) repeat protein
MKGLLLCLLILPVQLGFAQEARLEFNQANQLYRDAQYEKAAKVYDQVLKNGYESTALYYNLGNCYFKLHNLPAAILSYERAKRLAPHDEDVSYNLRLANLRVVDKIDPLPQLFLIDWWNGFIGLFSPDGWALAVILCAWASVAGGMAFFLFRSGVIQRLTFAAAAVSVICCFISVTGLLQQLKREGHDRAAVVFSPSVSVKSAPDNQSTDLFVLHEGVKVELLDAVGEWRQIRLPDGKVGWLTDGAIEVI